MGRPIHTNNSVIKSIHTAKVQHVEQHRDEARRQQFAMTLQQEAAHKEKQVQDTHKPKGPEIHKKPQDKGKRKKRQKQERKDTDEEQHVDLKID